MPRKRGVYRHQVNFGLPPEDKVALDAILSKLGLTKTEFFRGAIRKLRCRHEQSEDHHPAA
jgi:hypothetical protein